MVKLYKVQAVVTVTVVLATVTAEDPDEAVLKAGKTFSPVGLPSVAEILVTAAPWTSPKIECEHIFTEEID